MLYTKYAFLEDMLKRAIRFDIINMDTFNRDNFEEVFDCSDLDDGWDYEYGASKLVIIPKHLDFVVKIPFGAGAGYYDDDNNYCCDPFERAYYAEEDDYGWDYCRSEAEYYDLAREAGIDYFFARTTYIGDICGVPIYVQEKVEIQKNYWKSHTSKQRTDSKEKAEKMGLWNCGLNDDFLTELFDYYSNDEVAALFKFIQTYCLEDLTSGNVGYDPVTGAPVLSDYSDFNE